MPRLRNFSAASCSASDFELAVTWTILSGLPFTYAQHSYFIDIYRPPFGSWNGPSSFIRRPHFAQSAVTESKRSPSRYLMLSHLSCPQESHLYLWFHTLRGSPFGFLENSPMSFLHIIHTIVSIVEFDTIVWIWLQLCWGKKARNRVLYGCIREGLRVWDACYLFQKYRQITSDVVDIHGL